MIKDPSQVSAIEPFHAVPNIPDLDIGHKLLVWVVKSWLIGVCLNLIVHSPLDGPFAQPHNCLHNISIIEPSSFFDTSRILISSPSIACWLLLIVRRLVGYLIFLNDPDHDVAIRCLDDPYLKRKCSFSINDRQHQKLKPAGICVNFCDYGSLDFKLVYIFGLLIDRILIQNLKFLIFFLLLNNIWQYCFKLLNLEF